MLRVSADQDGAPGGRRGGGGRQSSSAQLLRRRRRGGACAAPSGSARMPGSPPDHLPLPNALPGREQTPPCRAPPCLSTRRQFQDGGCDNCRFLRLDDDPESVATLTTPNFTGCVHAPSACCRTGGGLRPHAAAASAPRPAREARAMGRAGAPLLARTPLAPRAALPTAAVHAHLRRGPLPPSPPSPFPTSPLPPAPHLPPPHSMMSVIAPQASWATKWVRLERYVPGCYALAINEDPPSRLRVRAAGHGRCISACGGGARIHWGDGGCAHSAAQLAARLESMVQQPRPNILIPGCSPPTRHTHTHTHHTPPPPLTGHHGKQGPQPAAAVTCVRRPLARGLPLHMWAWACSTSSVQLHTLCAGKRSTPGRSAGSCACGAHGM